MKATDPKPAEQALGWFGSLLSVPFLAPIAGIVLAMQRLSKSKSAWARALMNVIGVAILFPLFLLTMIVFVPYMAVLWLLAMMGLVRREPPPLLVFIESARRLDISAPLKQVGVTERLVRDLTSSAGEEGLEIHRWEDEETANVEISVDGDLGPVRAFAERIERDDPVVEVRYV